jgi:WD40 repeat protein
MQVLNVHSMYTVCALFDAHICRGDAVKGGTFLVLSAATLAVEHEGADAAEWITDVAYSSDSAILAVSSHDARIYLYAATQGYSK